MRKRMEGENEEKEKNDQMYALRLPVASTTEEHPRGTGQATGFCYSNALGHSSGLKSR